MKWCDVIMKSDCIVPFYHATTPHSYIGWGKTTHLGFGAISD